MNQRNIILQNSVISLLLLLTSCASKDTKEKSFYKDFFKTSYIISVKDSLIEHHFDSLSRLTNIPPPPPIHKTNRNFGMYYGNFNIIFYTNNRIFFHNKDNFRSCGTGLRNDETDFLDIQPNDIIEVSPKSAIDIIQKNKQFSDNMISIASLSNTIKTHFLMC